MIMAPFRILLYTDAQTPFVSDLLHAAEASGISIQKHEVDIGNDSKAIEEELRKSSVFLPIITTTFIESSLADLVCEIAFSLSMDNSSNIFLPIFYHLQKTDILPLPQLHSMYHVTIPSQEQDINALAKILWLLGMQNSVSALDLDIYTDIDSLIIRSKILIARGLFADAEITLQQALDRSPDSLDALLQMAIAKLYLGQFQEALVLLHHSLNLRPEDASIYAKMGTAYFGVNMFDKALEAFNNALQINPKDAEAWNGKGNVLQASGELFQAVEAFRASIKNDPYYPAWLNLGNLLLELGDSEGAFIAFEKGAKNTSDPEIAAVLWTNKGQILIGKNKYNEALNAFLQAIYYSKEYIAAWMGQAQILTLMERTDEAIEAYSQCLSLDKGLIQAWKSRGNAFERIKHYADALADYQHALELDSLDATTWNDMGSALYNLKKNEAALEALDKALTIAPKFVAALYNQAIVLFSLGRYLDVLDVLDNMIQLVPNSPMLWQYKSAVFHALNDQSSAAEAEQQALQLQSKDI